MVNTTCAQAPLSDEVTKNLDAVIEVLKKYRKEKDIPSREALLSPGMGIAKVSEATGKINVSLHSNDEEVKDLVDLFQNGNMIAYDFAFLTMIPYLTELYKPDKMPPGYDYRDYINSAYYVVRDSAEHFKRKTDENERETKFATFIAIKFNSPYIYTQIESNQFGMTIMSRVKNVTKFIEQFEDEHGRRPTDEEVAKAMNIKVKTVKEYTQYDSYTTVSIFRDDDDSNNGGSDGYIVDIEDQTAKVEATDNAMNAIEKGVEDLTLIQRKIVKLYYGFETIPGVEKFRDAYRAVDVCEYLGIKQSQFKRELAAALATLKVTLADYACADLA